MSVPEMNAAAGQPPLELSLCEREQIHIPGAIQPHGAMLAVLADSWRVTHASANLDRMIGRSAATVLGMRLEDVIGLAACRVLREKKTGASVAIIPGPGGSSLHLQAHASGRHVCIDIEPAAVDSYNDVSYARAQSVLKTFQQAATSVELCELAVCGLKAIGGYHRVMAYRFAEDGHGEVIAEAREARLEPFLGLHYPAADVPLQARRHYVRQRVGAIADSGYVPVPLLVDAALDDGAPLDLTHSALRSVSPYHREYMRNMKTAASLTVGLSYGAELWGLLVCHSAAPLVAGPELRAIAEMVGQVVSLLLVSLGEAEAYVQRYERLSILRAVTDRLRSPIPLADALVDADNEVLDLVGAAGALVCLSGEVRYLGLTPAPELARRALQTLQEQAAGQVLAIGDLGLRYPDLAECAARGSGALLLPLGCSTDDSILWFRPELSRTVLWGGNPEHHAAPDPVNGRVSLRTSFAAWKQTVNGRSAPWLTADLAMARDLGSAIEAAMAMRVREKLRQAEVSLEHRVIDLEQALIERERLAAELQMQMAERIKAEAVREDLQQQLLQSKKMESIGTMAGGVAHELNNLLQPILMLAEGLTDQIPEQDRESREDVATIIDHAERAGNIVSSIVTFARKKTLAVAALDVAHEMRGADGLLRSLLPAKVKLDKQISAESFPVMANRHELLQVVSNLVANASHAMNKCGSVRITLEKTRLAESEAAELQVCPGDYAELSVADTGCGIEPVLLDRIFEPFFTTKAVGQGTGLGLSVVYGIVRAWKGAMRVHSEIGHGTKISVLVPLLSS